MRGFARFDCVLLATLLVAGCGDDGAGAGGADATGAGGGAGSTAEGGGAATDPETVRILEERALLDACGLPEPCPPIRFMGNVAPPAGELACLWTALAATDRSGRFEYVVSADGCAPPCETDTLFYVAADTAYSSRRAGPLERCAVAPRELFQACLDAADAGEPLDEGCSYFGAWVEGCVGTADASCP